MSLSEFKWAARVTDIAPFHVMAILEEAKRLQASGRDIIHMEVGEPDFSTAAPIIAAGQEALAKGLTQYTPAAGLPELRQAIAGHYQTAYGIDVDPKRIIVTPGASGALLLLAALLVNPGDQVMMADPTYPCNRNFMRMFEGKPQLIPVGAESDYQLSAAHIEQYWQPNTRAAMLATPSNPTGTLVNKAALKAISEAVAARKGALIVDEIYQGLTYGVDALTALSVNDDAFVINSFSKYFGMTGWRLGWLVAPECAISDLEKLAQNVFLSAPTPSQYAALAAFQPDTIAILESRRAEFAKRRDYLLPALRDLGMSVPVTPEGAFYIYAGIDHLTDDSYQWCLDLLEQEGVAATPGLDFGIEGARKTVRFAYATDLAKLEQAVERIARFIQKAA
ncbi:Aspartate/methionine/tyrosine aminotransferase [Oceanospirillum multiglobuliferum]|uniref:Aminotransferase n=1 Tax=Oceanospirillum multiglobuliferum TaxID=64969 RepID=A0A1T4RF59_9GAMM|nr:pyridoxal phosphate-dependent aminotransferase [Oceanospirillum multiglobuliferum]OPX54908.1 aminotransferase [Oceanospirillum multiglobuliferum]SKA14507.1 Aspartate/methionine/tyrosine aminotransferase [Oceanospirillum multiglobuliferum]